MSERRTTAPGRPLIPTETIVREIRAGRSHSDIARRYRVGRRGFLRRVRKLEAQGLLANLLVPVTREETPPIAEQQRTALDFFLLQIQHQEEMLAAYMEQYRTPDGKLHMDPSAAQYDVRYLEEVIDEDGKSHNVRRIKPLDELLKIVGESVTVEKVTMRGADGRVEMRHLTDALANKMVTGTELRHMIESSSALLAFKDALAEAIQRVEPEVAKRIAEAVRQKMLIMLPHPNSPQGQAQNVDGKSSMP